MTGSCTTAAATPGALDAPRPDGVAARPRADGETLDALDAETAEVLEARELAAAVLAGARAPLPVAFPVVWRDGIDGPADVAVYAVEGRDGSHALEQLRADLAADLARPWPKGARGARVLYPCEVSAHGELAPGHPAPRTSLARAEVTRGVLLVLDFDRGGFRDAWELLRDAGVAAVAYPSPSAEVTADPLDATKARVLLPVAPCERAVFVRHVRAVSAVLRAVGVDLDASPLRPESACYVAPRPDVGPRPPSHALRLEGAALDLEALDARASAAGWRTRADVDRDTASERAGIVRPRDASAVFAALDAVGILGGPVGARGLRALYCPRAHWHGGRAPRGARGDTSAVAHEGDGWAKCSHDHSAAPEGERGPATLPRLVRWAAEDLRAEGRAADAVELLARWEEVRRGGAVDALREELAAAPFGEVDRRTVAAAAVGDELEELARLARRDGVAILATPTVGGGKTSAVPRIFRALLLEGELSGPREGEHALRASGVHLVRTRDDADAAARALVRAGVRAGVATPVHLHPAGCLYRARAEELYRAGVSARAVLCRDVPADADASGEGVEAGTRCERFDDCGARLRPFVPYGVPVEGRRYLPTVREGFAASTPAKGAAVVADLEALAPGEPWVAVATHASAVLAREQLRADALVFIDESDVALAEVTCAVTGVPGESGVDLDAGDGTALGDARAWARRLLDARVGGDGPSAREFTAAPRVIPLAILDALEAHTREHGHPALYAIGDPRAWCVEVLAAKLRGRSRRTREALTPLHPGGRLEGAHAHPHELAAHAFAWWERWRGTRGRRDRRVAHDPFAVRDTAGRVRPYAFERVPVPASKGAAFEALRRWAIGAAFALPLYPRQGAEGSTPAAVGTVLAHRSPAADAAAAAHSGDGEGPRCGVVCLDATGDRGVAERALRAPVRHVAIAVDDAAEVTRTVVHRDGSRRALCPGGAVRWPEVLDALAAAREALRQRGDVVPASPADAPVVCFTHAPIARALAALVRVEGLDGADGDREARERAGVGQLPGWRVEVTAEDRAAAEGVPLEARALVRELAAQGWRWSYFGAADARGSNAWRHARGVMVCGDARPSGDAMRAREVYARWYDAPAPPAVIPAADLEAAARATDVRARRVASAEHAQCFGRARVTQRVGARVHLVHVGRVPALDWYQRAEGAVRVAAASALLRAARALEAHAARGEALEEQPPPAPADALTLAPPHENAPALIRALAAQGWTPSQIAHGMRERPEHVAAWWQGRRQRQETRLTRARVAALEALAGGEGEGRVRAWFAAMLDGRGVTRVHAAARDVLRRATGLPLDARAFGAWVELPRSARRTSAPSLRPDVLAALAQLLPVLVRQCPPVRPPPGEPPSALRPVGGEELAGPVRARATAVALDAAVVPVLVRDRATGETRREWAFASDLMHRGPVRPLEARELAAAPDAPRGDDPLPPDVLAAAERIARAVDAAGVARVVDTFRRELAAAREHRRDVAAGAEGLEGPPD